ncbi:extracellular triacylglycerol lipase precursor [Crepidotus variabilis]|uniref:Extracellular triacylglycerol lipase n=1 Tax=Crepidotus variabilis TaxID=179855 RepID=A0A9P6JRR0_9AGAR|nr:extracellular triacylglycerol lipase precursor [Crepidotus variabilis]
MLPPLLYATLLVITPFAASASPQVKIGNTTIIGRDLTLLQQDFFGGIPFAEPPTGNLRLHPPVLKPALRVDKFDATQFGAGCISGMSAPGESEDCLSINVFRPSGIDKNAKLPVMFWTYGGGFKFGDASIFNASAILKQSVERGTPVIYVNFNYRLGPLGFPQGQEATSRGALNLAIKDQIAALQWVQANIGSFGGDKKKVTMFGESAGAIMTAILLLNPDIGKLARAAILESGSAASLPGFPASAKEDAWQDFVVGVPSCASGSSSGNSFDCLLQANTSDIRTGFLSALTALGDRYGFVPSVDGDGGVLPDIVSRLLAAGRFAHLPFIAGTNLDEGTLFAPRQNLTEDQIRLHQQISGCLRTTLSSAIDHILELYPDVPALGSPYNTGNETFGLPTSYKRLSALLGDINFHSQRRGLSHATSRVGVKTYAYLFIQPQPSIDPALGVAHASEITSVYGLQSGSAPALALSEQMVDYWVSFATSLDPNDNRGYRRPIWPRYTPQNEVLLKLEGGNTTVIPDSYRKDKIDFINSNGLTLRQRRGLD